MALDENWLAKAWPGISKSHAAEFIAGMTAAMNHFGITDPIVCAMFLAETGEECGSGQWLTELGSYDYFSKYDGVNPDGSIKSESRIRNLGNNQPHDGPRFRGRGIIQITGRYNYTQASRALGHDFVANPTDMAQPYWAVYGGAWWWFNAGLNSVAKTGDVTRVTKIINGGSQGLADRKYRYNICYPIRNELVPAKSGPPKPPTPIVQKGNPVVIYCYANGKYARHARFISGEVVSPDQWTRLYRASGKNGLPKICYNTTPAQYDAIFGGKLK